MRRKEPFVVPINSLDFVAHECRHAQIGDTVRITENAWETYFQPALDVLPPDSEYYRQVSPMKNANLVVKRLYEEVDDCPPMVEGKHVWQILEHGWYEIVSSLIPAKGDDVK